MINTITLNPAMDKILFIDKFEPTVTARIHSKAEALGGKGIHISADLALMGVESRAFGILFGETGRKVEDELTALGVLSAFVHGEGESRETRTNYVLIEDDKTSTIIADKGEILTDAEVDAVIRSLHEQTKDGDWLVLSGDASNVDDPFIYNKIVEEVTGQAIKVFIDASGETLKKAVEVRPFLIKPNRDELETVTGERITNEADVIKGVAQLERLGVRNVAVSLGSEGSMVKLDDALYRAVPPVVPVENTAGCGDCFMAGLLKGLSEGMDTDETIRYATAVSAAAAASPLSVGFDTRLVDELAGEVVIKKM
jgi:1-phosphofructokinase family hexose kinase